MNNSPWPRHLAFACLSLLLISCASVMKKPEPPRVGIAGLEILEVGLFEQRYLLSLRLQNPNDFALDVNGMDYEVFLNDRSFAHGVNHNSVTLPAFGEDVLEVEVISSLSNMLDQLRGLESGYNQPLSYRILGGVKINNWPVKIPFEFKGEIAP